ncbi:hypothetical protein Gotur_034243 [Gossypium turneri]
MSIGFKSGNKQKSIRDNEGLVLGSKMVINRNVPSSFVAEAIACVQSLQWGLEVGFPDVVLEGDSLSVIQRIQSKCEDKSLIGAYIRDCRELGQGSANEVAHVLATKGLKSGEQSCIKDGIKECAREAVERDKGE